MFGRTCRSRVARYKAADPGARRPATTSCSNRVNHSPATSANVVRALYDTPPEDDIALPNASTAARRAAVFVSAVASIGRRCPCLLR